MDYSNATTRELLEILIGPREAEKHDKESLHSIFATAERSDRRAQKKLSASRELVKRLLCEAMTAAPMLHQPSAVRDYLRLHFVGREYESFVTLFLDSQNRLIVAEELFRGTLTQTSVYPREIVKRALELGASAIILVHNHPSGDPTPSRADIEMTRDVAAAAKALSIAVHDHLVIGRSGHASFKSLGLL